MTLSSPPHMWGGGGGGMALFSPPHMWGGGEVWLSAPLLICEGGGGGGGGMALCSPYMCILSLCVYHIASCILQTTLASPGAR